MHFLPNVDFTGHGSGNERGAEFFQAIDAFPDFTNEAIDLINLLINMKCDPLLLIE